MKRFLVLLAMVGFGLTVATQNAHAILIVDTGAPTGSSAYSLYHDANNPFATAQWLAGQFTTTEDYTVNSLEGFMTRDQSGFTEGIIDAVLYFDNAGSLDPVGEISRSTFSVPAGSNSERDWFGATGLNINLNAGTYWLAFEVLNDLDAVLAMPQVVPNPLDKYAFKNPNGSGNWNDLPNSIGMRVDASIQNPNPNPVVPEPATMLLFGSGMAGAYLRKRRKV